MGPQEAMVGRTCERCGRSFTVPRWRVKNGRGRFCSVACRPGDAHCTEGCKCKRHKTKPAEQRFWPKVHKTESCWLWKASMGRNTYGTFYANGRIVPAYRFAYELLVGPIPDGLELDHVKARGCTSRACVNPAHLEPVTHRENSLRGFAKTHCKRGHEMSGRNIMPSGRCRECRKEAFRLRRKTDRQWAHEQGRKSNERRKKRALRSAQPSPQGDTP